MVDKVPFKIDGKTYKVRIPEDGIRRSFSVVDGDNAGRTLTGVMERDIIGTYYNYDMDIEADIDHLKDYDDLYEVLSSPTVSHTLSVPYAQSILEFRAYVTDGSDTLNSIKKSGKQVWKGLTISFIADEPKRRPLGK